MSRPSWKAPFQLVEPLSVWSSPLNPSRNHHRAITTTSSSRWLNATVATTSISGQCHPSLLSRVECHLITPPLLSITTTSSSTSTPAMQVSPMLPTLQPPWQLQCRCCPRLLTSSSGLINPIDQPYDDTIARLASSYWLAKLDSCLCVRSSIVFRTDLFSLTRDSVIV